MIKIILVLAIKVSAIALEMQAKMGIRKSKTKQKKIEEIEIETETALDKLITLSINKEIEIWTQRKAEWLNRSTFKNCFGKEEWRDLTEREANKLKDIICSLVKAIDFHHKSTWDSNNKKEHQEKTTNQIYFHKQIVSILILMNSVKNQRVLKNLKRWR